MSRKTKSFHVFTIIALFLALIGSFSLRIVSAEPTASFTQEGQLSIAQKIIHVPVDLPFSEISRHCKQFYKHHHVINNHYYSLGKERWFALIRELERPCKGFDLMTLQFQDFASNRKKWGLFMAGMTLQRPLTNRPHSYESNWPNACSPYQSTWRKNSSVENLSDCSSISSTAQPWHPSQYQPQKARFVSLESMSHPDYKSNRQPQNQPLDLSMMSMLNKKSHPLSNNRQSLNLDHPATPSPAGLFSTSPEGAKAFEWPQAYTPV